MRWLALIVCLTACNKKTPPPTGRDDAGPTSAKHAPRPPAGNDDPNGIPADGTSADAGGAVDAHPLGGNGSPARMGTNGEPHGPGGPLFMGKGLPCDAAHDHCLRPDVWFQADNIVGGNLFRALPVYQLDDAWYDWRNGQKHTGKILHTKVATTDTHKAGDPVVFYNTPQPPRWATSEYEAMTSSNWEVAIVEAVNSNAKTFRVRGWDDDFAIDAGRAITEQK